MSDTNKAHSVLDRSRVTLQEEHEMRYWTEKLGVSQAVLREAVQAVGDSPDRIFAYLRQRNRS